MQLVWGVSVPFLGNGERPAGLCACVSPGASEGCVKQSAAATGGAWGTFRCGLADGP